jgi:hypothetical protein
VDALAGSDNLSSLHLSQKPFLDSVPLCEGELRGDSLYTLTRRYTLKAKMINRTHPIDESVAQWIRYQLLLQNISE